MSNRFFGGAAALVVAMALLLTVSGCGGDDPSPQIESPTSTRVATDGPTVPPSATETPQGADELALIHQAAVDWVDGELVPDSSDCAPSSGSCVEELPELPASASEGMVRLFGADPGDAGAGWIILGKRADGTWGVFLVGNNLMPPTTPSLNDVEPLGYVCNSPEGLNVRSAPSIDADVLDSLAEGTTVQIEQFVLEIEATDAGLGNGWYEISSPVVGWVNSRFLSNIPSLQTCLDNYPSAQSTTESPATNIQMTMVAVRDEAQDYSINVEYPQFDLPIDGRISELAETNIEAIRDLAQSRPPGSVGSPGPYVLEVRLGSVSMGPDILSVELTIYTYTGGAHGLGTLHAFNVDIASGQELVLADALTLIGSDLEEVAAQTQAQLAEKFGQAFFSDGALPISENYETFLVGPDDVTFIFQVYQVAPYAAGPQKVSFQRAR